MPYDMTRTRRTMPELLFCLCLNPGKVGAPWLADPGLLIGEDLVSALPKAIRLIQGCALPLGEAVMIYILQRYTRMQLPCLIRDISPHNSEILVITVESTI